MRFYSSTIGKKIIVAVTGVVMLGFVVGHLAGNLQVFLGPEKLNEYAAFLKREPLLLWGTRIALLVSILLHVVATVQLTRLNRLSRPIPYQRYEVLEANVASRIMMWSGLFLLVYIVYHLLHLTGGLTHPQFSPTDVYSNVITGFHVWYVSVFYILGMISLGYHLYHGIWSVFQTLGLNHPKFNCYRRVFAIVSASLISLGYISIPVAVLMGVLR